jgi:hypothetical protein
MLTCAKGDQLRLVQRPMYWLADAADRIGIAQ